MLILIRRRNQASLERVVVAEIFYSGTGVFESLQKLRYFCVCVLAML